MTLPRQKERQKREDETEARVNEERVNNEQQVQVISNEQLMNLKLDKIQTGIDEILKLYSDTSE